MTQVLKANTDADFLAMVPALIGYHATNSLVCVAFDGTQAFTGFRMDLPGRRRASDYRAVATQVIAMLSRVRGANRVAPVIYTDATFAGEAGVPWLDFGRYLADRLDGAGFGLVAELCVAADGWANYFDPDYPREGRPLTEVAGSSLPGELEEVPALGDWSNLPEVSPQEMQDFLDELDAVQNGDRACELIDFEILGFSGFIEHVAESVEPLAPEIEATLLLASQSPANRDVIAIQVAFGQLIGEAVADDNDQLLEIQARTGGSMDDVVRAEIAAGRRSLDDELSGLLMGQGTMRPNTQRIARMIATLKRVVVLSPDDMKPAPLCILAWLLWARGLGSAAGHFVERALSIDPDYGMARLLHALFSSGYLPEWTYGDGSRD